LCRRVFVQHHLYSGIRQLPVPISGFSMLPLSFTSNTTPTSRLAFTILEILSSLPSVLRTTGQCHSSLPQNTTVSSTGTTFLCNICSKPFKTKPSLAKHNKIHCNDKLFQCHTCTKHFTTQNYLHKHTKIHSAEKLPDSHSNNSFFQCDSCNKTFQTRTSLAKHKKRHSSQQLYECQKCNKKFTTQDCLTKHNKTHSQVLQCDICKATKSKIHATKLSGCHGHST
uniref:C2H2-type domain-containing protein n=1 Tax=Erpetoichthys calabaricus TaxID=27687 RepID=A0A8C4RKW0_ERPCA